MNVCASIRQISLSYPAGRLHGEDGRRWPSVVWHDADECFPFSNLHAWNV